MMCRGATVKALLIVVPIGDLALRSLVAVTSVIVGVVCLIRRTVSHRLPY